MEAIKDEEIQDVDTLEEIEELEEDSEETEDKPALSARDQKMQEVVALRNEEIENNDGEPIVEREDLNGRKVEGSDNEEAVAEDEVSPVYKNEAGEYVMKLKINGQEVERPITNIIATAQKQESADVRLQQANDRQRQLEEYENLLRAEDARIKAVKELPEPSQQDAQESEEDVKAFLEQIYDGNTDEAATKLAELLAGRQQPTLNVEELRAQLRQEAVIELEEHMSRREYDSSLSDGVKWLNDNHPDVVSDPMLYQFIDTQTTVISKEDPTLTPRQVIEKATDQVLARVNGSTVSSRENNKSQLKAPVKASSSARYAPPKKKEIDTSPQAVIARQREHRNAIAGRRSV